MVSPAIPKRSSFPEISNNTTKTRVSPSTSFDTQETHAISFAGSSVLHHYEDEPHQHQENPVDVSTSPGDDESMSSSGGDSVEAFPSDFHQDLQQLGRAIESLSSRNLQYSPPAAVSEGAAEEEEKGEGDNPEEEGPGEEEITTSPEIVLETAIPLSSTEQEHPVPADKRDEMVHPFPDNDVTTPETLEDAVPIRMDDIDTDVGELQKLFGALPVQDEVTSPTTQQQQPVPITPSPQKDDYYHQAWNVASEGKGESVEWNDNKEPDINNNKQLDPFMDHDQAWNHVVGHEPAPEATKAEVKEPDHPLDFTDSVPAKAGDPFMFQPDATKPVDLFADQHNLEAAAAGPQAKAQAQNPFDDFHHPTPTYTTDNDGFPIGSSTHSNHHDPFAHSTDNDGFPVGLTAHSNHHDSFAHTTGNDGFPAGSSTHSNHQDPFAHTTDCDGFPARLSAHSNHHDSFTQQGNEPQSQNPFDVAHPMDDLHGYPVHHNHDQHQHQHDDDNSVASHDAQPIGDSSEHLDRMASFHDVESFC